MAVSINTYEPESFVAGDTVKWTKALSDYLPSTWTLVYRLVPQFVDSAGAAINPTAITATDNGDGTHLATLSSTASGALAAGAYRLVGRVTASGESYTIYTGNCTVAADPTATGVDQRSYYKKTLDALDAMIAGKATKDQAAWAVEGRTVNRYTFDELVAARDKYAYLWRKEQEKIDIAAGKGASRTPRVRF